MSLRTALLLSALAVFPSRALQAQQEDQKFSQEQERQEMEELRKTREEYRQPFLLDLGAFLIYRIVKFDDLPFRSERTLRLIEVRPWAQVRVSDGIQLYARLRNSLTDWNTNDAYDGDDNDLELVRIDQLYADVSLASALNPDGVLTLRTGRQFVQLGRGLLLNNILDGVQLEWASGDFAAKAVAARTDHMEADVDATRPNWLHSDRYFYGLELDYLAMGKQRPYFLALRQEDHNNESPDTWFVEYEFNSNYAALGCRGEVFPAVTYQVEGIREWGERMASFSLEDEDIDAWSATASLYAQPEMTGAPLFSAEYYFGSGDRDRTSPTNTDGGNTPGTDDDSFLAFGYLMTGYSLAPRLSNLHVLKLSATVSPFPVDAKNLQVGAAWYLYRKDEESGGISDPRASRPYTDVGREIDFFLRWRLYSDLAVNLNYGLFLPGKAYHESEDDDRRFFGASLTYSY